MFNNSAVSNWFIFISSLLPDTATLNTQQRETLGSCCTHAAEQEEELDAVCLTLRVTDRAFYYKCLCINTKKPVLVGFFSGYLNSADAK